jgi:acetylornithine deacetylase/succinyl-diaminopimelate desuccinylase-like protein
VHWNALRRIEPSVTDPSSEIVAVTARAAQEVLGRPPAINMRVGGSDARIFRRIGIPTVVYGPTPFNMGGADENVLVEELEAVARVHALAAFDMLVRSG